MKPRMSVISILLIVAVCVLVVGFLSLIILRYTYARPKRITMGPLDDEQQFHLGRLRKILHVLQGREPVSFAHQNVPEEQESGA